MVNKSIKFIFLLIFTTFCHAEQKILVQDDNKVGVSSKLYNGSQEKYLGDTDPSGEYLAKENCGHGDFLLAKPKSKWFKSGKKLCSGKGNKIIVRVTRKYIYENLVWNRDQFLRQENFAAAALASNELAQRATTIETANTEREKTLVYFSKSIGLPEDVEVLKVDPNQGMAVATQEFIAAVKKYQVNNGLKSTGKIDYRTLSNAAKLGSSSLMYKKNEMQIIQ